MMKTTNMEIELTEQQAKFIQDNLEAMLIDGKVSETSKAIINQILSKLYGGEGV